MEADAMASEARGEGKFEFRVFALERALTRNSELGLETAWLVGKRHWRLRARRCRRIGNQCQRWLLPGGWLCRRCLPRWRLLRSRSLRARQRLDRHRRKWRRCGAHLLWSSRQDARHLRQMGNVARLGITDIDGQRF